MASFELFTGSAGAWVVTTYLFCKIAYGLALFLGCLLAAGDRGVLLLANTAAAVRAATRGKL